jgi:hypothetical protein
VLGAAGKTVTRLGLRRPRRVRSEQLKALGLTTEQAARMVADSAYASPWFQCAFTAEEVRFGRSGDPALARLAEGWFPARCGDVELVPRTNVVYEGSRRMRAGHGGPMRDHRLVPFVLYGEGVRPGVYRTPVSSYDIAATTARLLGIEPPAQCEGTSRDEALR